MTIIMSLLLVRRHSLLLVSVMMAMLVSRPQSQSWAQSVCGTAGAAPLQVQNATGATELAAAVNCTDGGTVEVTWVGTIILSAPISIGSGTFLTITGADAEAEVLGGSQGRLFEVTSGGGLTLTQLKLSGGSAASGGAVYSNMATVMLDSCVFDGNAATEGDGGAVWASGGDLTIVGGEFLGNSASGNGGAVYTADASLVVQDGTTFESNVATRHGGGLLCIGAKGAIASCSVTSAVFTSNKVTMEADFDFDDLEDWDDLFGGGGAMFAYADVNITDSVFEMNFAQVSGGALFGHYETAISINGCTINNNTTPGYGGGVVASSATLGGDTLVTKNEAGESGGGVFGWEMEGLVEFNDVECSDNLAVEQGGGFYASGKAIIRSGTLMTNNTGDYGGCVYGRGGCDISVNGGEFDACHATGNGAFLFASDGAVVTIYDGTFTNGVADRRAGAVYCSGDSNDEGGSKVTIHGGTFTDNQALELGGAIVAWGTNSDGETPTVVNITGGYFSNNTAKFYGGFIFLEELASLSCEGATIENHYAGDQGGAIYGRDATWVNSSCDLIGNRAPQGAAIYLTHTAGGAYFENHEVTDNVASGGSVVYATESPICVKGVIFQSDIDLQEDSSNRAIQLEGTATFDADGCVFDGWLGDTVIYNANPTPGSLVVNSSDFTGSAAVTMAISPHSAAVIRNAFVGQRTIENAVIADDSAVLVDNAVDCNEPGVCGPGECVEGFPGVLCECLSDDVCLDDGGALSIVLHTPPPNVTYSPDVVYFELMVSAADDGTTPAIWELTYDSDKLSLQVLPPSGVLPPGGNVTVSVTGSALEEDVGGNLVSRFVLTSVGSEDSQSTTGIEIEVESAFYLCQDLEYALPVDEGGVTCMQCVTISGSEGVDCENPGATLASLPIREGHWRSSKESLVVQSCLHPDACSGATQVETPDDYCEAGYEGPYCAVCAEGYGQGAAYTCHSCTGVKSGLLIFVGSVFTVMAVTFLFLAVVFLVGGLDAVENVRQSVSRTLSVSGKVPQPPLLSSAVAAREGGLGVKSWSKSTIKDSASDCAIPPAPSSESMIGRREEDNTPTPAFNSGVPLRPSLSENVPGNAIQEEVSLRPALDETNSNAPPPEAKSGCCGFGERIKRWASRLPMDKIKILVVVWQILTVFPSITGVEFPPAYARFLSWVDVVNLDVGNIFSSTCIFPTVNFYQKLLLTTLSPLALGGVLVLTFRMAKRRAGIGSHAIIARRAAWSRHMAAGLLLTFLVFTSTSTMSFQTFPCDTEAVEGESYLRADYSLSCNTTIHTFFEVYAGFMIVLYPIGIPLLYAWILWRNRESLNPRVHPSDDQESGRGRESKKVVQNDSELLKAKLDKRSKNPDLVPSMFLWKDFGPHMYYYEVIECGRRILLTGVLIFFPSGTASQAAMACIFAFASLLGFELLRPHLDNADSWLYRLGCVVIFLSNFLALLIKADAAGEGNRNGLGGIMIALNTLLILAVLSTSWFATHQQVEEAREDDNALVLAKNMLTFQQEAAESTRISREEEKSPTSATSGSVRFPPRATSTRAVGPRRPRGSGSGGVNEDARAAVTAGRRGFAPRAARVANLSSSSFADSKEDGEGGSGSGLGGTGGGGSSGGGGGGRGDEGSGGGGGGGGGGGLGRGGGGLISDSSFVV